MVKIRGEVEFTVEKINNGAYKISTMYEGYYRHKVYIGYTKQQAIEKFKEALIEGEI